jgi:hypothetical protein
VVAQIAHTSALRQHAHRIASFEGAADLVLGWGGVLAAGERVARRRAKCGVGRRLFFVEVRARVAAPMTNALVDWIYLPAEALLPRHAPTRLRC